MKQFLWFLYFVGVLFYFNASYSQRITSGKLMDAKTEKEIPFATIVNKSILSSGVYTDENGNFSIAGKIGDTLKISMMGYKDTSFPYSPKYLKIFLVEKPNILPAIILISKQGEPEAEIGFSRLPAEKPISPGIMGKTLLILVKDSLKAFRLIKNLIFHLKKYPRLNEQVKQGTVRIYLNGVDPITLKPNHSLLPEDIIITNSTSKKPLIIDIQKYAIYFPPEGIYIGIEWLGELEITAYNINPGYLISKQQGNYNLYISFYGRSLNKIHQPKDIPYNIPLFGITVL